MELKPGYKQTEVGVIPEDWDLKNIGGFVTLKRGHDLTWRDRRDGDIPIMGSAGPNGFHDTALAKGPGVVLGRSGASFGQAHYCELDFWPHNTALYVTDFKGNNPLFAYYLFSLIDFSSHNSGGAQQSLNRNFIAPIGIGVPSPEEQGRLAKALSDVDELIKTLEELISKKRNIKQAAMQELLTGKRRLPGSEAEWVVRELGSLGTWRGGMTPSMQNPDYWNQGDFPWISSGDVKISRLSDTSQHVTSHAVSSGAAVVIPGKSIVLVTRSGILRKQLPVSLLERPMAINQDIKALIPARDIDSIYLLHALTWAGSQILKSCMKTGTTVESVEFAWLKRFTIPVPSHEEQIAIAKALSDMEGELAEIEAQRAKASALKQGMMQQLLTGKIRLT